MTYEEIKTKRDEISARMLTEENTPELEKEWDKLSDEEAKLEMEDAIAIAKNDNVTIYVRDVLECGWAINIKAHGEWDYDEFSSIVDAMKRFSKLAKKYEVKTCHIKPYYLDMNTLVKIDTDAEKYRDEEEYRDACMASAYGDDRLLDRYNRKHGIEKEYSPSNPWDAPGMSIHDFI